MRTNLSACTCHASVLMVLAACGGESKSDAIAVVARDSAGIHIVESPAIPVAALTLMTMDSVPQLSIGEEAADEHAQLHRVRDATRLADGRVAIANAGSH